jgi:heme/copper-type cytochrome/quinol oxidase subunit 3
MEASASAPTHPEIELEPPEWQPRANWIAARLLAGAAAFFFLSFVFAYFYLRSQDANHDWKIGAVHPGLGWGIAILVVLLASAVALRAAVQRPALTVRAGGLALALAMAAIVLQVVDWTTLDFGPASGGYASVFVGWTVVFTVFALGCVFWIETQVATAWRRERHGVDTTPAEVLTDTALVHAGLEACSLFWTFYVAGGVILFVALYVL